MKIRILSLLALSLGPLAFGETGVEIGELNADLLNLPNKNQAYQDPQISTELLDPPNINWTLIPQDYEVGIYDFTAFENIDQSEERITPASDVAELSGMWAIAPVHFSDHDKLTSMTFYGTDTTSTGGMIMELRRKRMETNEIEVVATLTTFEPTGPLLLDLEGNILWSGYSGSYVNAFDHVYWPTDFIVYIHDRTIKVDFEHTVDSNSTYYVYLYTIGEVSPGKVNFWSASFTAE